MKFKILRLVVACSGMFFASAVFAQVLASYDFKGQDGAQVATKPSQVASHLEVSEITRGKAYQSGVKVGMSKDGMAFMPKAADGLLVFLDPYAIAAAEQNGAYFELTLKPAEGYVFSVKSVLFGTRRASKRTGPNYMEVRSSLDGFTKPIITGLETAGAGGNESLDLYINFDEALMNLKTPVTLRFYGYGRNTSTDQNGIWVITNPAKGLAVIQGEIKKAGP